jgi:predicted small metal-binding protein
MDNNVVEARGEAMAKIINCECGYVVRGETDDELVENALAHLERDHPELIGKRSADEILAAAEEV